MRLLTLDYQSPSHQPARHTLIDSSLRPPPNSPLFPRRISTGCLFTQLGYTIQDPTKHHCEMSNFPFFPFNVKFPPWHPVIFQTHPHTFRTALLNHALFPLMSQVQSPVTITNQCQVDMPTRQWQPLPR